MTVPVVAIVGRPNVGKSSLFNWLAGRRIAIVDPTAGVTRDRISTLVPIASHYIELVDTGGIGVADVDDLTEQIERQIAMALDQAQVILFVVDGRAGLMRLDDEVAQRLRRISKPVICVANKCDTEAFDPQAAEFYKLGFGKVVCVSAQQNRNRAELLRLIQEHLKTAAGTGVAPVLDSRDGCPAEVGESGEPPVAAALASPVMKLAIVGRRNTGKSTFINCLAQSERVIVSEVPGTTRDSIDVRFERDGLTFLAIDTAGVRKKKSLQNDIEFYSLVRAERSIRRADVVLLFLDATQRISKVDKQLAEYVLEQYKPAVFVVNKWDLMRPMPTSKMGDYIRATFPSLDFVPIAFVTAKSGKNVHAVLNLAQHLHKQASARIRTGDLNRVLRHALEASPPPLRRNRRPKVYYATQAGTNPPTLVLFTNGPELFDDTYQRYLLKTIRDRLHFNDVPIRLYLRRRQRAEQASPEEIEVPQKDVPQESELWRDV